MIHYTLDTGHTRQSPRSEVSDETIAELAPLLRSGSHPLPHPAGYTLRVTVDGSALLATVSRDAAEPIPLVTVGVAPDAAGLDALREVYGKRIAGVTSAPACVVQIHPTIVLAPGASHWLGDLERCIAWAWIEHRRGAS